ncbi:preprotein translocase subunit SecG [Soehngenia longivitae]|uniref:Protein-export membrane protein SecG n=1 Tax=Soehngenia longivitae TaxID=2562294 RepID=A0A4Z0D8N6_9FIRM|nr:preprotein translocase subunit SecG [Soehngenia longivitae]TFZ41200.1 preprotein translocase subunit SecG [Soehngenia longivitae]
MATFFAVLMLISSLVLIVSVLMQESKQEGLGAIGGGATDSIFGKSIGTSKQALLRKVTIVASVVFMISALGLAI